MRRLARCLARRRCDGEGGIGGRKAEGRKAIHVEVVGGGDYKGLK